MAEANPSLQQTTTTAQARAVSAAVGVLHHVHDLAEFADLEPSLARDRMYLLAVLLNLVAVLGDEFLPAVCGELRSAIEPRYRLIGLTKPSARACTKAIGIVSYSLPAPCVSSLAWSFDLEQLLCTRPG
jgi:hypothetical protein